MSKINEEENKIRKDVLKITWPVFVEVLLGTLFGMVDMIMLGRIKDPQIGAASIAAVGLTNQPLFIGLSLVRALSIGGTAMVARYVGGKRKDEVENVVKHLVILNQLLLVLPIFLIGFFFTENIMSFLGAQSDTLAVGQKYFKVIMIGFIFQSFNLSISAIYRGIGNTKIPMEVNIKANFLNVIGNAVLIYGLFGFPELGVTGAGISTAISHVIASGLLLKNIFRKDSQIYVNLRNPFKFNQDIIYNLIKVGVPASLEQLALRAGVLLFVKMVASLGTVAYATHQICLNISGLAFTSGQAFGIASSSLTGRSLGAGKLDDAEKYIKVSRKIGSIIATLTGIIFFFFGSYIAGLYTRSDDVIREASKILKIIAFIQPFQSSQLIMTGGLRGTGDTVWTLIATFFSVLVVRVILAYIFVMKLGMGLIGAWFAMFSDQIVRWSLVYYRFKTDKWKYISLR